MSYTYARVVRQTDDFQDWLDALKDVTGRARVLMRIDRLAHGNPGSHRNLSRGISELKIDAGPGYRVYYSRRGGQVLLLLVGGYKSTQPGDIARATWLAEMEGA